MTLTWFLFQVTDCWTFPRVGTPSSVQSQRSILPLFSIRSFSWRCSMKSTLAKFTVSETCLKASFRIRSSTAFGSSPLHLRWLLWKKKLKKTTNNHNWSWLDRLKINKNVSTMIDLWLVGTFVYMFIDSNNTFIELLSHHRLKCAQTRSVQYLLAIDENFVLIKTFRHIVYLPWITQISLHGPRCSSFNSAEKLSPPRV